MKSFIRRLYLSRVMTFNPKIFRVLILAISLLSCIHNAKAQTEIVFGDTSLPPNTFILGDFMTVHYEFNEDDTVTMAIRCDRPNQFFGLGLGTSMIDSDIWVFEIVNSAVTVTDYYSETQGRPTQDAQNDLKTLGYEITPEYTLVKIRRALDTGDEQNDKVIQAGMFDFIYATGQSPTMVYHGPSADARGTARVNLVGVPVVEEQEVPVLVPEEEDLVVVVEEEETVILEEAESMEEEMVSEEMITEDENASEGQGGISGKVNTVVEDPSEIIVAIDVDSLSGSREFVALDMFCVIVSFVLCL